MANVFGDLYKEFYSSKNPLDKSSKYITKSTKHIRSISIEEINTALKELKNGKCPDTRNMAAELLKQTGEKTRRIIAKKCTDIMRGSQIPTS